MTRRFFAAMMFSGILAVQAAEVPRPSPDFPFVLPGGKPAKLADWKGKVCVVEFLMVTCPHCQNTARVLSKLQTEYGKRGLQVIGISIHPNADTQNFVHVTGSNFPVGSTLSQEAVYAYLQHSIMSSQFYVPQLVIIDRNGVIREQHGGTDPYIQNEEQNLRKSLEPILNESAAKKPAAAARSRKKVS